MDRKGDEEGGGVSFVLYRREKSKPSVREKTKGAESRKGRGNLDWGDTGLAAEKKNQEDEKMESIWKTRKLGKEHN